MGNPCLDQRGPCADESVITSLRPAAAGRSIPKRSWLGGLLITLGLLLSGPSLAIVAGETDTFDADTENWFVPIGSAVTQTGGVLQMDDTRPKLVMLNRTQWIGDYNTLGATAIRMDIANPGTVDLTVRLALGNGTGMGGTWYISSGVVKSAGSGFTTHTFDLSSLSLAGDSSGSDALNTVLGAVAEARILHSVSSNYGTAADPDAAGMLLQIDNIQLLPLPQTISGFAANPTSGTFGGSSTLSATASSGLTVTFGSNTTGVCTVAGSTVSYVGVGTCTATADQAGNAEFAAASQVTLDITVGQADQTISGFAANPTSGTFGGSSTLSATASSGLTVTFGSNTMAVCTVSGSTVSYVGVGTCTVTADQAGNANFNAASQETLDITVGQADQTITGLAANPDPGTEGGMSTLSATASSGLTVTFGSTTPAVCTVSGTTATYVGSGTCTITADQAGNANFNAASQVTLDVTVNPAGGSTPVFINELHYDNTGADSGEMVEVAGPAGTDLTGWSIVFYNGSNGTTYATEALSGTLPNSCSGLGVSAIARAGIQNGAPDGLALVDNTNAVIQFLSYEGAFTATNGVASGMTSTDIGVAEASSTPVGHSLQLTGTGTTYEDFTWAAAQANTFGSCNTGQTFVGAGDVPPQVASSNPADQATQVAVDASLVINFSESVNIAAGAFTFSCTTSGAVAFTPSVALPTAAPVTSITLDPDSDLAMEETCTVTLTADSIADVDGTIDTLDGDGDGTAEGSTTDDATIQFSTVEVLEIFEIQGNGTVSPFATQTVITADNIVTAVGPEGFFMQTPDARDDADTMTSNGIYVFTATAPTVMVGDSVDVTGEVVEFFEFTEFTNSPTVMVNSSGNALPTAVVFDANTPSPDPLAPSCDIGAPELDDDNFECFEGMRIQITGGSIGSGNQTFGSDPTAEAYITAGPRAFRETGIEFSESTEPGLPMGLPIWDENPELFELDPDKLGLPNVNLNGGSTFDAEGALGFEFGGYELWPTSLTVTENSLPQPARMPSRAKGIAPVQYRVASLNVLRLYNDVNDPGTEDDGDVEDSAVYAARLSRFSAYIRNVLGSPDVIAFQEVENIDVLDDLAAQLTADDAMLSYSSALVEGNDVGGIDVGYLYSDQVTNVTVTQHGAAEQLTVDASLLHDRPPLQLRATLTDGQDTVEINLLVVHMRSLSGITGGSADRVRQKRLEQAVSVATIVANIDDPAVPLVVLGDFNAFQFTDGYVDVIGEITGDVVPADNERSDGSATVPLTNPVNNLPADEQYSFVFRGNAQVLDHALLNTAGRRVLFSMSYGRGNADGPEEFEDDLVSPLRVSDHDGFVLLIGNKPEVIFMDGFE